MDTSSPTSIAAILESYRKCAPLDRVAAGKLLDQIASAVRAYCRRRTPRGLAQSARDEIAENVEHAIVIDILLNLHPDLDRAFWGFVRNYLRNAVRIARRRGAVFLYIDPQTEDGQYEWPDPNAPGEVAQVMRIEMTKLLDALPAQSRHAFVLHHLLEYEISTANQCTHTVTSVLTCSEKTARRRIKAAEKKLRDLLTHFDRNLSDP